MLTKTFQGFCSNQLILITKWK